MKMTIEKLDKSENWMEDQVKKPLNELKTEVVENKEKIPPTEVKRHIDFYNKCLDLDIFTAKKIGLTQDEEKIIRKVFNELITDIKKHPNAYIMSVEKLKKVGVPYSKLKDEDKYGFIEDFELRKTLGAEFNSVSEEEEAVFDKYHILEE